MAAGTTRNYFAHGCTVTIVDRPMPPAGPEACTCGTDTHSGREAGRQAGAQTRVHTARTHAGTHVQTARGRTNARANARTHARHVRTSRGSGRTNSYGDNPARQEPFATVTGTTSSVARPPTLCRGTSGAFWRTAGLATILQRRSTVRGRPAVDAKTINTLTLLTCLIGGHLRWT